MNKILVNGDNIDNSDNIDSEENIDSVKSIDEIDQSFFSSLGKHLADLEVRMYVCSFLR
jgi:hypothetical protein